MKQMNRVKVLLTVAMIAVLLTAAIGGTVAWIATSTDPVKNEFTPGKVDTTTDETMENGVKTKIVISNAADSVKVYVRVAVIGNYVDDETGSVVASWTPNFTVGTDWFKGTDGYYYYTKPVDPAGKTSDLLGSNISPDTTTHEGAHLEVTVIHQSIQAEPISVVTGEWKVTMSGTTITGPQATN